MTRTAVQERSENIEGAKLFSAPPACVLKSPTNTVAIFVYSIAHAQEVLTEFWRTMEYRDPGQAARLSNEAPLNRFKNTKLNLATSWQSTHSENGVEAAKFGETRGVFVTFETLDGRRFPPAAAKFFSAAGYSRQKKLPLSL